MEAAYGHGQPPSHGRSGTRGACGSRCFRAGDAGTGAEVAPLRPSDAGLDRQDRRVAGPGVINPRNVDKFVGPVSQGAGRLPGWRSGARSALTQIGRAVNPHAWGDKTTLISGRSRPLPYDADEEGLWQMFGRLPGARDPARRLWVVAASCSLGMRGSEISLAETSDIHERDDGRLAVDVRGRKPRRVPVRECWTDAVREAVALVNERPRGSPRRFVTIEDLNAAARTAASLPEVVEGGFSLPAPETPG